MRLKVFRSHAITIAFMSLLITLTSNLHAQSKEKSSNNVRSSSTIESLGQKWKHSSQKERLHIAEKLVSRNSLIGKNQQDVEKYLGSPSSFLVFKTPQRKGKILVYSIGEKRELCIGISSGCIVETFCGIDGVSKIQSSTKMNYKNPRSVRTTEAPIEDNSMGTKNDATNDL